jgi:hypothetical protein
MPVAHAPAFTDENADPVLVRNRNDPFVGLRTKRSALPSPVKSAANTIVHVSAAFQRPKRLALKFEPLLVSTCQAPLFWLRTAMSALPSPLKSPTVGNW